ncbi:gamma carbonic anhydrase family protein [Siphonobacter aquaeclarae]|uniref:Carbonic anhydrase or acetyltransferase, isoleucine patch superfamily n=1 Tax=Siphonobacter aquaeclarae TaxID=563176 RepID=A0A1G9PTT6_9BACT|nr:gamma carbonic anhydrase family protein [Siphonobacter aquaeclarae]SDM01891.1 Carbonic anhydrase or acetyltransferase, isoleucine patch superfamily [Siphonobacter aquaeclarae]
MSSFLAPGACIMGDVTLGDDSSVWYNAVLRGDVEAIRIGDRTNIQDTAVIHADPGDPTVIGNDVTVGHGAIVHGATVGDGSLIGMRATVLNKARIGRFCLIGANALVTEGMEIPDYSLVLGVPAKVLKTFDPAVIEAKLLASAQHYVEMGHRHASGEFPLRESDQRLSR